MTPKRFFKQLWLTGVLLAVPMALSAQTTAPPPPTNLHVVSATSTSISLGWNSSSGADTYKIEREIPTTATWSQVGNTSSNSYQDTSVTAGTTYNYRVSACAASLCSEPVWLMGVTAGTTNYLTPPAPSSLTASQSGSTVALNWSSVAEATHYNVERSVYPTNGTWTYVCSTTGSGSTSCSEAAPTSGTYYYRVEACREGNGCSGAWNQQWAFSASLTFGSSTTCTGFTLTANKTSYTIGENVNYTWACASGLATYVEISLVKPDSSITIYNSYSGGGQSSMSLGFGTSNLVAGNYTLRACWASGCPTVNASAVFSLTTSGGGGETYYPPSSVTAAQSGSALYISWPVPAPTPPFYKIQRSINGAAYTTLSENNTSLNYTDSSSLTSGSTYKYRVYSCAAVGTCSSTAAESNAVTFSTDGGGGSGSIPPPPASLSATLASPTSVSLAWSAVTGANLYNVYRSSVTNPDIWTTVIVGTPVIMGTQLNISAGTYKYRVESCATNYGCSGAANDQWRYSEVITITGSSAVPTAPSNLRIEGNTSAGLLLRWNDNASNEDKHNLERKLSSTADWSGSVVVQLQGANMSEYLDAAVTSGTTYDYRLQACLSGTGCSAYTYLYGVTAGSSTQQYRAVTVKLANNQVVPYGAVTFLHDNILLTASLINAYSTVIYLLPGEYDMQPSFPGVNNDNINLTGSGVSTRKLVLGNNAAEVTVTLPSRLSVKFTANNSSGQPLSGANVIVYIPSTTTYASTVTDSAGNAWLQLPAGNYQGKVIKSGYLTKTTNWSITDTATEFIIDLETLSVKVSGKVLLGDTPKANAIVKAFSPDDNSTVIVNSNSNGEYSIYLKAATWQMYAIADGYEAGAINAFSLSNTDQIKDLTLGAVKQLISSSANIVNTISVTVTATELGVALGLPANALGGVSQATVTIRESTQAVATPLAAPLPRSVRDISAVSGGQDITNLTASASIELSYTDADITALGAGTSDINALKVAYWNATNNDWQVLSSVVDTANRKVRAATNHFTLFAIVLPFLAQPASAEATTPPAETGTGVGEVTDERAAQFSAILAEGTKVYVSCSQCLAASVNKSRDEALEQKYNDDIVDRVVGSDNVSSGVRTAIVNFVTYGTSSTIALGAGERGGVVGSFRAAYGHLPNSEYEWQEVLKIANGRWPGTLLQEREQAMKATFRRIYLREAQVTQSNDSAALAIMAYGLRSAKRNLTSEASAISSFRAIYSHAPASSTDWDAVRAIAYSGAKR